MFNEADRRDPEHKLTSVALVDGNNHQIDRIKAEARNNARSRSRSWLTSSTSSSTYGQAAGCFFPEGDPAAERWVK